MAAFQNEQLGKGRSSRSFSLDELIMGTNNSSIVSKRSVEKLYYPGEPHYFRYFVKKFQRRAPLINRGYWLRLRAIDIIVQQFLQEHRDDKRVVINLGCDIDYPNLMRSKRSIVLETPILRDILEENYSTSISDDDLVLLRSDRYCQIGCDLRELGKLRESLDTFAVGSHVLFVAEVSITYMDTEYADSLIQWAGEVGNSQFCLLEQLLPCGPEHPFAVTMLEHFRRLNTPPKSVLKYPTLPAQVNRFINRGFRSAQVWDLWEAWSSDKFVSEPERAALDEIEPFDEWEEFALFCRHYFIIHASNANLDAPASCQKRISKQPVEGNLELYASAIEKVPEGPKRRYGDALRLRNPAGGKFAINVMGIGTSGREGSCDIFSLDKQPEAPALCLTGPAPRMGHTLTDLGEFGVLLVGGRSSPANALSDCWILKRGTTCEWKPTYHLPVPLFRHSSIRLHGTCLALVAGGKTGPSSISAEFYVFHASKGWFKCQVVGSKPPPTFGGILCNSNYRGRPNDLYTGLLAGGIGQDFRINEQTYTWQLELSDSHPVLRFELCPKDVHTDQLSVFGARTVDFRSHTLICGGTGLNSFSQGQVILSVKMNTRDSFAVSVLGNHTGKAMPLMIGSSVLEVDDGVAILGGGATCFSMGTYWEVGARIISIVDREGYRENMKSAEKKCPLLQFVGSQRFNGSTIRREECLAPNQSTSTVTPIRRILLESPEQLSDMAKAGLPVIIEKADLGACVRKWTPEYMVDRVGYNTKVIIHDCIRDTDKLDFNTKNFNYKTEKFGIVMKRAAAGERIYLRALSHDKPADIATNIDNDFPGLAADFRLPGMMQCIRNCLFSSVLRVSGKVNMWLHYDVMANMYTQIAGSRRMILFPPGDISLLSFTPGASTSSLDIFSMLNTAQMEGSHPYEAVLEPGDILFLPPLWPHTATAVTNMSIAVNVFFKNLEAGYAMGRDVYGNRDLAAYEKGRLHIARIGKSFEKLPLDIRRFYLKRLANELETIVEGT
ncbi:hypothetical protein UVI_02007140 [Ustilaginoidea virens]|uniref:tRNA wybutosine-synthesizing protein 4 n=1 Tax=Ustilaginoidea virens TaxID=1159556 RepID=A0A1B5KV53_USTVR|nr:hypothetical protein UVI_02007140 [Ustilaginoidea virens]